MKQESQEFQISADEMECLTQLLSRDESLDGLLTSQNIMPTGKVAVRLTRSEAQRVRDRLTTEVAARGFDETYSPNDLGRTLEGLIDRFYVA